MRRSVLMQSSVVIGAALTKTGAVLAKKRVRSRRQLLNPGAKFAGNPEDRETGVGPPRWRHVICQANRLTLYSRSFSRSKPS